MNPSKIFQEGVETDDALGFQVVKTPPSLITIRLPFASRYFPNGPNHTKITTALVKHYCDSKSLPRQQFATAKGLKMLVVVGGWGSSGVPTPDLPTPTFPTPDLHRGPGLGGLGMGLPTSNLPTPDLPGGHAQ